MSSQPAVLAEVVSLPDRKKYRQNNFLLAGQMHAEYLIGNMYEHGYGVTVNQEEAARWYRYAAEHGFAEAQNALGFLYLNGRGVEKNDETAVKWFHRAAQQGHAAAQTNLGVMYANGRGVARNEAAAVKWFWEAASWGNAEAQEFLGMAYQEGWYGVPRDAEQAEFWLSKSRASRNP
jgi:TPR repeat protein